MKHQKLHAILLASFALGGTYLQAEESVLRFHGQLKQMQGNGTGPIQLEFDCVLIDGLSGSFFYVIDSEEGCPWPDTYGTATNAAAGGITPHLLYRFDGMPYIISLPDLKMSLPENLSGSSRWDVGNWNWRVSNPFNDANSLVKLEATERRGRKQTATFDRDTGWLANANLDVFMGRGEKFELQLKRTSLDKISNQDRQPLQDVQQILLKLQYDLNRRPDGRRSDLTARQIQLAASALQKLQSVPKTLPVQPLLNRISQQIAVQSKDIKAADSARADMLGKTITDFALTQLDGHPFDTATLTGKPTVLHFWPYSQNAMEEPYGQVAYLEFMKNRSSDGHFSVIGVVTNPLVRSAERKTVEIRSARKVTEFMNLSYPVLYDDGQLQERCDPNSSAADDAPVWIVLDATGKVVHFHQGFYEVDRKRGLKELADAIDLATAASEQKTD